MARLEHRDLFLAPRFESIALEPRQTDAGGRVVRAISLPDRELHELPKRFNEYTRRGLCGCLLSHHSIDVVGLQVRHAAVPYPQACDRLTRPETLQDVSAVSCAGRG